MAGRLNIRPKQQWGSGAISDVLEIRIFLIIVI